MTTLLPRLSVNANGWGPSGDLDVAFPDIPYTPYSKSDRLGKAADWTVRPFPSRGPQTAVNTTFNAYEEEDEEDYSTDRIGQKKNLAGRKPYGNVARGGRGYRGGMTRQRGGATIQKALKSRGPAAKPRGRGKGASYKKWGWQSRSQRKFGPSIDVQPDWGDAIVLIDFAGLTTDRIKPVTTEVLASHGKLERFNKAYTKINVRTGKPLEKNWAVERKFYQVTTSDDPVLAEMIKNKVGNVYATDAILTVLMSTTKSIYSWDVLARRIGDDLILDKRDNSNFDFLTVNENCNEPPMEDVDPPYNSMSKLHHEATFLNHNFSQQVLNKEDTHSYPESNPFQSSSDERVASVAYFYKRFDLGDGISLVARTEVDAFKSHNKKPSMLLIKALNEYDPKITDDWHKKLENQKAGAFATEVKNNGAKMSKWALQAELGGAEEIKLGYVSRANPRDPFNHLILALEKHNTQEFARELGLDFGRAWGALRNIIENLRTLAEGTYIILREPNRKQLQVYKVPDHEFEKK